MKENESVLRIHDDGIRTSWVSRDSDDVAKKERVSPKTLRRTGVGVLHEIGYFWIALDRIASSILEVIGQFSWCESVYVLFGPASMCWQKRRRAISHFEWDSEKM